MRVTRLRNAPIITPDLHPSIGHNIQGPSLIRVPDWVSEPLGSYYLYFADHKGSYIRLAYADDLRGPWKIHPPGTLQLADSYFPTQPLAASEKDIAQIKARWHAEKGTSKIIPRPPDRSHHTAYRIARCTRQPRRPNHSHVLSRTRKTRTSNQPRRHISRWNQLHSAPRNLCQKLPQNLSTRGLCLWHGNAGPILSVS